jgi:glycosidase
VRRAHAAGLKVILDFVPNHVARGYHSILRPDLDFGTGDDQTRFFTRYNHFFYLPGTQLRLRHPPGWDPPGVKFDGFFPPEDGSPGRTPKASGSNCARPDPAEWEWYETVKLNYGFNFLDGRREFEPRPRTWGLMDQILAYWQDKGVDGFRCDMAHYVPREAWEYLIPAARQRNPDCFFLAEAYPTGDRAIPITNLDDLLALGFAAFYHSDAYNALKRVYQGSGGLDDYDRTITPLSAPQRDGRLAYLENHDERRLASAVEPGKWPGDSGFGSATAGYQLAPLQYLFGRGPVLFFNGQEIGEPGADAEGFSSADGRTTAFDYWCMPQFAKWVNGHAYDGGGLSEAQRALRGFYADLLALCQDPAVRDGYYWGLRYFNRPARFPDCPDALYTFARFQDRAGRLLLIAANFRRGGATTARVRLPSELVGLANLPAEVSVKLLLDRQGARRVALGRQSRQSLSSEGFMADLPDQTAHVYVLE